MAIEDQKLQEMQACFLTLKENAFSRTHYQLADLLPNYTIAEWREFLITPEISDWINEEQKLLKHKKLATLIDALGDENIRSTGLGQQVAALQKIINEERPKEGIMCIYSYVPLNDEQAKATNVETNDVDIFAQAPILPGDLADD